MERRSRCARGGAQNDPSLVTDLSQLEQTLVALGCPADKAAEMAAQLDKRAAQLAERKNRTHEEALAHLLKLMSQGWAAKERGF